MKVLQRHKILCISNRLFPEDLPFQPRLRDRKFLQEMIEITGAPGSGKTTFIKKVYPDEAVLLGGMPLSYGSVKRVLCSFLLFLCALVTMSISFKQTRWLVKKAVNYDETLFFKMNALRNSMTKFGYHFFRQKCKSTLVDEGVSHIPFIIGLEREDVDNFIMLFRHHLEKIRIIFIETPPKEILKARIISRGHKRVRGANDAGGFVDKNVKIAEYYKEALIDAGFDVTVI